MSTPPAERPRRVSRRVVRPVGEPGAVAPEEQTLVAEPVTGAAREAASGATGSRRPSASSSPRPASEEIPAPAATEVPLVPNRSADDSNLGWHEVEDSNDDRLRRDVPPHWA